MNRLRLIRDNLDRVHEQVADAAQARGRTAAPVTLVVVTKYVSAEVVQDLVQLGCRDLGESRPQQLWDKTALIKNSEVNWHMIGHLQRNKVQRTVPLVKLIHSLDSLRLMHTINSAAAAHHQQVHGLLEVNISGDETKHGWHPEELLPLLEKMNRFPHLSVRGMMAMASRTGGLDQARRDFVKLRDLRDRCQAQASNTMRLDHLSMGMSRDFTVAIEEGATIVRVGSAVFTGVTR